MLAFVGAGFVDVEENGRQNRKPIRIVISNYRGENDTRLTQARKEFRVYRDWLPERRNFVLYVAGQDLPKGRQDKLNNIIMWCLRHKEGPETIGKFLAREIQAMNNPTVGKNIMCTFVPRAFGSGVNYHLGGILFEILLIALNLSALNQSSLYLSMTVLLSYLHLMILGSSILLATTKHSHTTAQSLSFPDFPEVSCKGVWRE